MNTFDLQTHLYISQRLSNSEVLLYLIDKQASVMQRISHVNNTVFS